MPIGMSSGAASSFWNPRAKGPLQFQDNNIMDMPQTSPMSQNNAVPQQMPMQNTSSIGASPIMLNRQMPSMNPTPNLAGVGSPMGGMLSRRPMNPMQRMTPGMNPMGMSNPTSNGSPRSALSGVPRRMF